MTLKLVQTNKAEPLRQRVRDSLRETKVKEIPQCVCGSRTYTFIYTGTLKQRICVLCLLNKRIVEM